MSKERVHRDFTGGPLCLFGRGVTKVFGVGGKKTAAANHVDFDFHEGEYSLSWASPAAARRR